MRDEICLVSCPTMTGCAWFPAKNRRYRQSIWFSVWTFAQVIFQSFVLWTTLTQWPFIRLFRIPDSIHFVYWFIINAYLCVWSTISVLLLCLHDLRQYIVDRRCLCLRWMVFVLFYFVLAFNMFGKNKTEKFRWEDGVRRGEMAREKNRLDVDEYFFGWLPAASANLWACESMLLFKFVVNHTYKW